jgi:hypothetical protein
MTKTLTSPVKRFSGTVELSDPLTFPQYMAWSKAVEIASAQREKLTAITVGYDDIVTEVMLPAILACIEAWHIAGVPEKPTVETFPATPRRATAQLIAWLAGEIGAVISEEDEEKKE